MSRYIRSREPNTSFFFTVVSYGRTPIFVNDASIQMLRESLLKTCVNKPFETEAIVILPDHIHVLWTLPEDDCDYSTRWRLIKQMFTKLIAFQNQSFLGPQANSSRERKGEKLVWQRRFWEHTIRDENDFKKHLDYIHYNPVKHGYVKNPFDWQWSSFRKWVEKGEYDSNWGNLVNDAIPGAEWD